MKNYIIIIALCISANVMPSMASDLTSAKRNLNAAQKELSQITTKRDKTLQKREQMQAEYTKALAKIDEKKDKPESLAYKDAVKKSEALNAKIEQFGLDILSYQHQIDSLTIVVAECESALQSAQQTKEDAETAKRHAKDSIKLVKQLAKDSAKIAKQQEKEEKQRAKEECAAKQRESDSKYQNEEVTPIYKNNKISNSEKVSATTSKDSSNRESKKLSFWEWIIFIGICVVVVWIFWVSLKRSLRCSQCGRWFAYEKDGVKVLNKQRDKNTSGKSWTITYERKYRCRYCGHKHSERGQIYKSSPNLPSEWY